MVKQRLTFKKIMKYTPGILLAFLLNIVFVSCSNTPKLSEIKVTKGQFNIKIHAVGQLKSTASFYINCPFLNYMWENNITFLAPEGSVVKAGTPIAGFDSQKLNERLRVKTSELQTAKNELNRTRLVEEDKKATYELELEAAKVATEKAKLKASQPEELSSQNDVKKLKMEYELARLSQQLAESRVKNQAVAIGTLLGTLQSNIKRLEQTISEIQADIEKTNIKAPKAGIVVYSADWRGKKSAVGDNVFTGQNIMELPDLNHMEVAAVIPEPAAGKVKSGMAVEIRLDSNPEKVFKGKLKSLGRLFRTKAPDQPAMVFDASISIDNPDPAIMRPGMAATVDIIISSKADVVQIPENAILYQEEGLFVRKKTVTGKKVVPITIGDRSGGMVEVLSGLSPDDEIIVSEETGEEQ